jgi:ferredoxin
MPGYISRILNGLHAYVYGRWTRGYISLLINRIIPRLNSQGKKTLADGFHCKVLTHEHAKAIITINRDISKRDLEQIIPYPAARTLVLKGPPDIVVYECACRHSRKHSCQPTQVCMIIGKSIGDFILKHHPTRSRRISQAEALDLLEAEQTRGHVHSAWFKDALGGRFYAICNCCKCCCFGIEAMVAYGTPMVASSGYVVKVDEMSCNACGACKTACPFGAIEMNGVASVKRDKCMGCGVCTSQCSSGAMALVRDERKGIPLDVRALI